MPLIHRPLTGGLPIVTAYVGVSGPRREELVTAGLTVPDRERLDLLISTGAKSSVLDRAALAALGLVPTDADEPQYDVSLKFSFDQGRPWVLETLPVLAGDFPPEYDGLLGRVVLANCVLTLAAGSYTLAF